MKTAFAALIAALPLAACGLANGMSGDVVQPSGSGGTRSFDVAGFTAVALKGADDVEVRHGAGFAVTATGDSALLDQLEIRKDGDTLQIGRKDGDWRWRGDKGAKITVTLPRLTAASVAGSGDMAVDRADGDFSGAIAGSGDLSIAQLNGGRAGLSLAGSGDMKLGTGQASEISAKVAGSGNIDASGVKADRGKISIAGAGNVRAQFTSEAKVSVVGSGNVDLTGGAKCDVSKLGSGEVRCS
ncbi:head GIN domain-containing protein [Sphingomonas turrisvirgatae]|uniref:Putative auto-transporter adhesin head GIN domain-containing protein n=1 Tax=Sphingomonas turrisvirgatae TaxID=1888892 RepID=A0A1E3LXQ8_9SPHN|nr:head GIN domain-containing protein [Sphingomonas turrisvirgatae]ODP37590.1 hypothetical protein BFL28_17110 [Sphingomonas turrisvirgatae]